MAYSKGFWEPLTKALARITRVFTGPSKVLVDTDVENHIASLTVHSVHGYEVTLNCEATYFKRLFDRWYVPSRKMAVYRISAIVPPNSPQRLKEAALDFTATFPRECMYWLGEVYQKQRAIEAYLDLLLAKLDRRSRLTDF
jgi:hypothetical protein